MPGSDDIEIQVSMELAKALSDLKDLEQQINEAKKSVDSNLSPSVDNAGTKITGFGGKVTQAGQKIKSAIGTETALAFTALSAGITAFTKKCIDGAMQSEAAWRRFGSLVNSNGGNWAEEEASIKSWAKTFSNEVGRSVGDTREASMAFLEMGMSSKQLDGAMRATAGVAARAGMTEAEASEVVRSALLGKGRQLEKLTGLRIDDYKNAEGQVDQERLLNDLYNQNKGAIEDYANSTEGQIQKINNSWNSFKTSIGQALLPVVKIIAQVVGAVVDWFANLPGPAKTVIAILLLVVGAISTVIGVLGMLAPILINLGTLMTAIGEAGGVVAFLSGSIPILGGAIGFLAANLLPIIAIVIMVVAAFYLLYETGKKMGWWNDLSGMVSKFGEVLGQVAGAIMNFASWFVKLFTDFPAAQKEFQDFINGIGNAILDGLGEIAGMAYNKLVEMLPMILQALFPLPTLLFNLFTTFGPLVIPAVTNFVQTVWTGFNRLVGLVGQTFWNIVNTIRERLNQAQLIAMAYVQLIRLVIVTRFNQIIARVRAIFTQIVNSIRSRLANAVSAARQKAVEIYNNIVNKIKELPKAIGDEIAKIPGKIRDGLASAAAAALTGGQNIVANFLSGLQRHSPGKIQRETIAEFSALPGIVTSQGLLTAKATGSAARGIVGAWSDNMETLGVNMESVIPQFNALSSGLGVDLGIVGASMNGNGLTQSTPTITNNTNTNNNGHTTVYQVDHMTIDLNNLETDEREQWYRMLQTVTRGV